LIGARSLRREDRDDRRKDKLVQALGITILSKSQVSEMAKELDAHVEEFHTRRIEDAGPLSFGCGSPEVTSGVLLGSCSIRVFRRVNPWLLVVDALSCL